MLLQTRASAHLCTQPFQLIPQVRYCGAECQRRHWAAGHREECGSLRQEAA